MGLDISVISQMRPVEIPEGIEKWSDEYYDWESERGGHLWTVYQMEHFPHQGEGLPDTEVVESLGEEYGFRAGSYSGYGEWRDDLATAAGYPGGAQEVWSRADGGEYGFPFEELINFPDNEGVIGPVASQKLYKDFVEQEEKIMKSIDEWYLKIHPTKSYDKSDLKWFIDKYNDWKHAFKLASDNGMVIFH